MAHSTPASSQPSMAAALQFRVPISPLLRTLVTRYDLQALAEYLPTTGDEQQQQQQQQQQSASLSPSTSSSTALHLESFSNAAKHGIIRTLCQQLVQSPSNTMNIVHTCRSMLLPLVARMTCRRWAALYCMSTFEATADALSRILLVCHSALGYGYRFSLSLSLHRNLITQ
jgi:hypothetical protein